MPRIVDPESAARRARLIELARPHLDALAGIDPEKIGPPPHGPLMCFRCATGTCHHDDQLGTWHGGGLVPAMTMHKGTALCLDCATEDTPP